MRRRKRRVPCDVCGETEVIYDRLMCQRCFMLVPLADRKEAWRIWRELKPFIRRKHVAEEDLVQATMLHQAHKAQCDKLFAIARTKIAEVLQ